MLRSKIILTDAERAVLKRLPPVEGAAFKFWGHVAAARGVDPATIISTQHVITGLPIGHGKHWCYPYYPLKCERKPPRD